MASGSLKGVLIYSASGGRDAVLGVRCAWEGAWRSLFSENGGIRRACGQRDAVPPIVYPNISTRL